MTPFPAMTRFALLPEPPYNAIIFSSQRTEAHQNYIDMAKRVLALASKCTIANWKTDMVHQET